MSTLVPENEQQFGSILTYLGENAEQNAKLLKKEIDFTHIAFGDANDTYIQPNRAQTSLVNELGRIPINAIDVIQPEPSSPPILSVQAILPDEYNDIVIRELSVVSIFNDESYIHAVGNCARIYVPKPSNNGNVATPVTLEMLFVVTSVEPIVKIDPNLIVASRDYVNKIAAQITNEWFDGLVFPIRPDEYCSVGDVIKTGTVGVRVRNDDGEIILCRMNQPKFGEVSDIDSKNFIIYFKDGKSTLLDPSYNTSSIRDIQKQNFNVFAKKLASDDSTESINIVCRGDSLTYGEDELVGQRVPDSNPTSSGRIHTKKRALTTYPEALAGFLAPVFQNQISVINEGFSGDNTKLGWNDWDEDVHADL
ncbi:phage tail protein, partial [Aliivibrio fischeri]|uniref:phage tail-collar fiber domain-containing protein n=1 Tax=Aliivibrio fischeri TaxID=668 RepID=UPI00159ECE91